MEARLGGGHRALARWRRALAIVKAPPQAVPPASQRLLAPRADLCAPPMSSLCSIAAVGAHRAVSAMPSGLPRCARSGRERRVTQHVVVRPRRIDGSGQWGGGREGVSTPWAEWTWCHAIMERWHAMDGRWACVHDPPPALLAYYSRSLHRHDSRRSGGRHSHRRHSHHRHCNRRSATVSERWPVVGYTWWAIFHGCMVAHGHPMRGACGLCLRRACCACVRLCTSVAWASAWPWACCSCWSWKRWDGLRMGVARGVPP